MKKSGFYISIITFLFLAFIAISCSGSSNSTGSEPSPPKDTTSTSASLPTVKTINVTNVTKTNATIKGKIVANGGVSVTERGVVWALKGQSESTMNSNNIKASAVRANGTFSVGLTNLSQNTIYQIRTYAINKKGTAYSDSLSVFATDTEQTAKTVVYVDSTSFQDTTQFQQYWDLYYPWGNTHNGSAEMYQDKISLQSGGVLRLEADRGSGSESHDPPIHFHSGAVHFNKHITVDSEHPRWVFSGDFRVSTDPGTWPAFWLSGANNWPPEIDMIEFKGSNTISQNAVTGPSWQDTHWQTKETEVQQAGHWHHYKMTLRKVSDTDVSIKYFIDGEQTTTQIADFVGKPFWLIMNLQMEGSSGSAAFNLNHAKFEAKNVYVAAFKE